jgi:MYXO-CTERM domain-containing protein
MENAEAGANGITVAPVIVYPTGTRNPRDIGAGGAVRAGNVVTVTTSGNHGFRKGTAIAVADIDDNTFNGNFHVASVPSPTTFTYADVDPPATSGSGTVQMHDFGNVILGGTFYDATQFPAAYRQNFFFGDHGSSQGGAFGRAETEADGSSVTRVTRFGQGFASYIDTATGPDGALYIVEFDGTIFRVTHDSTAVGLVVSPQNLRVKEGSRSVVGVRLTMMPAGTTTVTLTRATGSSDVTMGGASTAMLTFTTANWQTPQFVEVAAAMDSDTADDMATIDVTAASLTTETVTVRVIELGSNPPMEPDAGVGPGLDGGGGGGQPDAMGPGGNGGGCSCGVSQGAGGVSLLILVMLGALAIRSPRRR